MPNHDDRHLFEMLILEGAQAGLSWITILRKRHRYREVFDALRPPEGRPLRRTRRCRRCSSDAGHRAQPT